MSEPTPLEESSLADYLRAIGLADRGEAVAVEKAGDGNINWVRRARGAGRSWIVKQARPALERFPQYRASTERIVFEARYYEVTAAYDAGGVRPRVIHFDERARVLVLEDLGDAERLDRALARGADARAWARALAAFLGAVHAGTGRDEGAALAARFRNGEMRALHGEHIFALPLRPNDFPLSEALRQRARALAARDDLVAAADAAFARYRTPRGALVHADAQPGNVLLAPAGPKLLDAEIAHVGDPAFDVGILLGHLALPAVARGEAWAARPSVAAAWQAYADAHGAAGLPSFADAARYAGLELLRRTVGAARVPTVERDAAGLAVLDAAARWIVDPPSDPAGLLR